MFKKIFAVILAFSIVAIPVLADISFTDMDSSHWSYQYVNKLVNDGTVKGYEDGSFRPNNTVTRAEFVKMIGCGPERVSKDFEDVSPSHWGYEYIMTSGFPTTSRFFYPDKMITRGETIEILWKRNGSPKGIKAPSVITKQYKKNVDAVAWAYSYKVMVGDDGLNLRLQDTISRAEAAALIIKTRETNFNVSPSDFKDIVSEKVMETVFESYNLFDDNREYTPDATITNGEMSRAALRLASDEFNLLYGSYGISPKFEHEYAKDVTIIVDRCIKKDVATKEFAVAPANVENTVSAFMFAGLQKTNKLISYGNINNTYKDVSKDIDGRKNVLLTFAYENGIVLKGDETIGALNNVTHKDIAALLLQLDELIGMETAYIVTLDETNEELVIDVKLNKNIASYPLNKDDFGCIISGIDNYVYEKPFIGDKPKDSYNFSREYAEVFVNKLKDLVLYMKNQFAIDAEITVYPNLIWNDGKQFVLRLQCNILNVDKDISVSDLFGDMLLKPVEGNVKVGDTYFIETYINYAQLFM